MGVDGSSAVSEHPWRNAAAQVFVDDLSAPELSGADAHHLSRVLRLSEGERVCAADGKGGWRMCSLSSEVLADVGDMHVEAKPTPTLTVGFAAPKGDRTEWAIRKLTEVGVDRIVVLRTERSVVRWQGSRADKQLAKMHRWTLESARQCRRLWLPAIEIASPTDLPSAVIADAGGRRITTRDQQVLVGPEGGWANGEREGREIVGLGEHVLRTETAAVVAGAAMVAERLWSD
ncbi:MAG: RsmE family RNA methyltransferase [Microthrixaceae bacterium]